ncbi:MAG: preprotein translocase subunit SecG [Candidatus Paceibacterota bacterium]
MSILTIIQIIISVVLIASILLQQRGGALGSSFGGSGEAYSSQRGFQKKLYWATIVLGSAFIIFSLINLVL